MPTQCERILAALERGPITPIDFAAPDVIDGLAPIMRVAARIQDLRDQGHRITTSTSRKVAQYQLDQSTTTPVDRPRGHAADAAVDRSLPVGGALFNPGHYEVAA